MEKMQSDTIGKLADALAKAQGQIKGAVKDSENPFFKSSYADLASVWEAIREPLSRNGLAVSQFPRENNEFVVIETMLMHASGEWVSSTLSMKPLKNDPQSIGSCLTYNRRYSLMSIVGVAPLEDDDAEQAQGRGKEEKESRPSKSQENKSESKQEYIQKPGCISQKQAARFHAITSKTGASRDQIKNWLKDSYLYEHTADIPWKQYQEICEKAEKELGPGYASPEEYAEPGSEE